MILYTQLYCMLSTAQFIFRIHLSPNLPLRIISYLSCVVRWGTIMMKPDTAKHLDNLRKLTLRIKKKVSPFRLSFKKFSSWNLIFMNTGPNVETESNLRSSFLKLSGILYRPNVFIVSNEYSIIRECAFTCTNDIF